MTNWKSATCEKCIYQIQGFCRRFPPMPDNGYPLVRDTIVGSAFNSYECACAEYTKEGQPTPFEQAAKLAVDKGAVAAMDAMAGSVSKPLTTYDVAEEAWKAT